ncbi:MAG: response regulator [Candidatus Ozemobacteraceae bacterium]
MKNEDESPEQATEVRRRTEEMAREKISLTPEEARQALQELRLHQIELKMQNEELRRAQVELDTSRARYFALYDQAPVGYCTLSEKGLILEANLTAAALLGEARDGLFKQPITRFISKEDQDLYYLRQNRLFETGEPQACEVRMMKSGGGQFWSRLELVVAQDADGGPLYRILLSEITERKQAEKALQNVLDELEQRVATRTQELLHANETLRKEIAERMRAEEALRESEYRSKAMLQAIPDMMFRMDSQGVFLDYKAEISDLYVQSEPTIIGKRNQDIFGSSEFSDMVDREIRAVLENRTRRNFEYQLVIPGKGIQDYEARMVASGANEVTAIVRNVTERNLAEAERKKLEAQNRRLQKSESLARMAEAIAHHFNNQLQAVTGNLEMVLWEIPHTAGRPIEFLNNAMRSIRRASEVSSMMLTYLGQTPSKREPLDLSEVCRQNLLGLTATMPKNVMLESDIPSSGLVVSADAGQIQKVLTNLITNAWEASGKGQSVIHVSVKTALSSEISEIHRFPENLPKLNNAYALLEVTDTGCGIVADDIDKIFDPFFSNKFVGRGLGLPVVLGIVRAHEGIITVESEPSRGSIFRVYFPLTEKEIHQTPKSPVHVQEMKDSGVVLLVEDDEMIRDLTALALTGVGFTVLTAQDGFEAVEVFRQHMDEIRCVLCDLTMPRMDGWETLTALRQLKPGIPVILVSGHSEVHVMAGNHSERPQAFLSKPYQQEQLYEVIRQAMAAANSQ